ncbi:hypothetical protein NIIDMKKI_74430 [Mycobacterium kansasii]|uniref:ABC transporter family protein n=1 Tax=Mycobacterium kansasii TaxID=1768 RepID=A0A7G1IN00_MYCKA|nr:hypothetical protein NIIDMKKI_74430 [Mycobacterium kansasii]
MGPADTGGGTGRSTAGRLSERRRAELRLARLGYLFQDYNLLLTDQRGKRRATTALPGVRKPAAIARARQLLHELDLGHRPTIAQRIVEARNRVPRLVRWPGPDVILADEPTANLDSATGKKVSAQLASAASPGLRGGHRDPRCTARRHRRSGPPPRRRPTTGCHGLEAELAAPNVSRDTQREWRCAADGNTLDRIGATS